MSMPLYCTECGVLIEYVEEGSINEDAEHLCFECKSQERDPYSEYNNYRELDFN